MSPRRKLRCSVRAPRPDRVNASAGLLARGSGLGRAFPPRGPLGGLRQWRSPASLAAYSCGGSRRVGGRELPPHCVPFSSGFGPEPKQKAVSSGIRSQVNGVVRQGRRTLARGLCVKASSGSVRSGARSPDPWCRIRGRGRAFRRAASCRPAVRRPSGPGSGPHASRPPCCRGRRLRHRLRALRARAGRPRSEWPCPW